ncbi:MAG: MFS transporter [Limnochordia bacterium]
MKSWMNRQLPLLLVWTNSYERLTWTPILVLLANALEAPEALAYAASAYSAANLVGNILLGAASDRLGPFRVAGASLLLLGATTLLHLEAWSALSLVLVRALHGFFASAVTPTSLSAAVEGSEAGRRGRIMARLGMVIALASVVASPVAGRMVDALEVVATLRVQALFLVGVGALGLWAGSASKPVLQAAGGELAAEDDEGRRTALDPRVTAFACAVGFAVMFGQNVLFYALPLKATAAGFGPAAVGGLFGLFALGSVVAFSPPFSKFADRYGRLRPIAAGSLVSAAGMFLLGVGVQRVWLPLMAASLAVYGFGFGLVFPAVSAAAADGSSAGRRGTAFGLLTAAFSVGAIVGPLLGQAFDPQVSPFTLAALVMLSSLPAARLARAAAAPVFSGRA